MWTNGRWRCHGERWFGSVRFTVEGSHITHPHGDGCSDAEAYGEMVVATGAFSSCGGLWWHGRWCYGRGYVDWQIEGVLPVVSPIEDVRQLDPVGWHGDRLPTHEELHCVPSPWQDMLGAAVKGSKARHIVSCCRKTCGLIKVAMHECSQGDVACCWNCSEAGHLLAELWWDALDPLGWHLESVAHQVFLGARQIWALLLMPVGLSAVRIPRRTKGSVCDHGLSAWHMMAAFSVWWKRPTPLSAGWWAVIGDFRVLAGLIKHWRSLAESAAVLLLVDSLSWCSLGASIVVTDVMVLVCWGPASLYLCHRVVCEPMGIGDTMVSTDLVVLFSLWEIPTPTSTPEITGIPPVSGPHLVL
jgi:hypothetical protein